MSDWEHWALEESYTILSSTPTCTSCAPFAAIKVVIWDHANRVHCYRLSELDLLRLERRSVQSIDCDSSQLSAFSFPFFALMLLERSSAFWRAASEGWKVVSSPLVADSIPPAELRLESGAIVAGCDVLSRLVSPANIRMCWALTVRCNQRVQLAHFGTGLLDQVKAFLRVQVTPDAVQIRLPILLQVRGDTNPCEVA